jgi:hypothetical protein
LVRTLETAPRVVFRRPPTAPRVLLRPKGSSALATMVEALSIAWWIRWALTEPADLVSALLETSDLPMMMSRLRFPSVFAPELGWPGPLIRLLPCPVVVPSRAVARMKCRKTRPILSERNERKTFVSRINESFFGYLV